MSNVQLVPNVIVRRISEQRGENAETVYDSYDPKSHKDRLTYFQLIGLYQVAPLLYSSSFFQRENLTPSQTAQMEAYLQSGSSSLWPELKELTERFAPMNGSTDAAAPLNPFEPDSYEEAQLQPDKILVEADLDGESESQPNSENLSRKFQDDEVAETADGQEEFLASSLDTSFLVMAPPGTGKTHILIERLGDVIRSIKSESPNNAVLVLSFTRSAVSVIVSRVLEKIEAGADDDLRYLNIRTFDSYATYCLLADHDYESLVSKDYDARIQLFNRLLKSESGDFEEAMQEIDRVRFLFVDEIQDLVGDRAELVLLLVERVLRNGGSVTVLGDPAQAIYDWQVRENGKLDSRGFLSGLRELLRLANHPKEIRLTKFWRYQNKELKKFIEEACRALGGDGSEPDGGRLSSMIAGLDYVDNDEIFNIVDQEKPTVILTRKNADMHQLARWCASNDLPHRVIDQAREQWPPWIARLLGGFEQDEMSRGKAKQRWDQNVGSEFTDFEAAWRILVNEDMADENHIDLVTANAIIRQRSPSSATLGESDYQCLTISNIHKSKGREYENVLLLDPDRNWAGNPEEVRTIYVAATRAREHLAMLRRKKGVIRDVRHHLSHDLVRISNSLTMVVVKGLEDMDFGSMVTGDRDANEFRKMQHALWHSYVEDTLSLRLRMRSATQGRGILFLEGEPPHTITEICEIRSSLSTDMWRAEPHRPSCEAVTLKGFTSIDLCTYAFDLDSQRVKTRFGASGLGLIPLVSGLGELVYE